MNDKENLTTIQVTTGLRDDIRKAAKVRAKQMDLSKLSMIDYLRLLLKEQPK